MGKELAVRAGPQTPASVARFGGVVVTGCPLVVYVLIAIALAWQGLSSGSERLIGVPGDSTVFVWWLHWFPWAVGHDEPLLTPTYLYAPEGVNALWCSSVLLLGALMSPVTIAFGPIVAYNVAVVLALSITAFSGFLAARHFVNDLRASFLAGLIYGFNPFMVHHAYGHLNLIVQILPPIALVIVDRIVRGQDGSPERTGALLGVAFGMYVFVTEDTVAVTGISLLVYLAILLIRYRRLRGDVDAGRVRYIRTALVAAAVGGALIAVPTAAFQLFGPNSVESTGLDPNVYVTDLMNLFVPTPIELFHLPVISGISDRFTGDGLAEHGAYFGLPLLILVFIWVRRRTQSRIYRDMGLVALILVVLSMGPFLHVGGNSLPIPMPSIVLAGLPVTSDMVYARFVMPAWLLISIIFAGWFAHARREETMRRLTVIVALTVLPLTPSQLPWTNAHVPEYFKSQLVHELPMDGAVLVTPVTYHETEPMLWQVASGMRFSLVGGNAYAPGRHDGWGTSSLQSVTLRAGAGLPIDQQAKSQAREDFRTLEVKAVVVTAGPDQLPITELMTELLCRPPMLRYDAMVWLDTVNAPHSCLPGQPSSIGSMRAGNRIQTEDLTFRG